MGPGIFIHVSGYAVPAPLAPCRYTNGAVGQNPNLAFYAWRLQNTRSCSVTMVDPSLDPSRPLIWDSLLFSASEFVPDKLVPSVDHLESSAKYDFVIVSVSTLQSFQDVCSLLVPHVRDETLIIVESTGCVNLEPFVLLSFPKFKDMPICSIMNESNIKRVPGSSTFIHHIANSDHRIYLGTCSSDGSKSGNFVLLFTRLYKLLQMVQEDSNGHISLLKSNNAQEFMTYQWKLALPRIVLNPLSILFEEPSPEKLHAQILAKPLISGLVNEIFKIIKKMKCKLVKGFENEANLVLNWLAIYPASAPELSVPYLNANLLFYKFYHRQEIDIDLLLLQPILLGDDHGVRTPYLENLYSVMCQYLKVNTNNSSLFFVRNIPGQEKARREIDNVADELSHLRLEKEKYDASIHERQTQLQQLESSLSQKKHALSSLLQEIDMQTRNHEHKMKMFSDTEIQHQQQLAEIQNRCSAKQAELAKLSENKQTLSANEQPVIPADYNQQREVAPIKSQVVTVKQQENKNGNPTTPDLSDFAHVAVYGAELNGEHPSKPQVLAPPEQMPQVQNKEMELQRREQALLERERELEQKSIQSQPPMQREELYFQNGGPSMGDGYQNGPPLNVAYNGSNTSYNGSYNGSFNGPYGGPNPNGPMYNGPGNYRPSHSLTSASANHGYYEGYDQRPPHGLPANGMVQGSMPAALRNPQKYPPSPVQVPPAQRQRMSSYPTLGHPNAQFQQPQFAQQQVSNGPIVGHGSGQFNNYPKKQNRRSAFPDQALNIDYGGRGGMPMPTSSQNAAKSKHRSTLPGQMPSPPLPQQRKSNTQVPSSSSGIPSHLRPPQEGTKPGPSGSNEEIGKSANGSANQDITIEVPQAEIAPKPLGSIAPATTEKKKKRGLFRKS